MAFISITNDQKYILSLDSIEIPYISQCLLKSKEESKVSGLKAFMNKKSYYVVEILSLDKRDNKTDLYDTLKCNICNVKVPKLFYKEHLKSQIHINFDRLSKIMIENANDQPVVDIKQHEVANDLFFCQVCSEAVAVNNKENHLTSLTHSKSKEKEKMLNKFFEMYFNDENEDQNELSISPYDEEVLLRDDSSLDGDIDSCILDIDGTETIKFDEENVKVLKTEEENENMTMMKTNLGKEDSLSSSSDSTSIDDQLDSRKDLESVCISDTDLSVSGREVNGTNNDIDSISDLCNSKDNTQYLSAKFKDTESDLFVNADKNGIDNLGDEIHANIVNNDLQSLLNDVDYADEINDQENASLEHKIRKEKTENNNVLNQNVVVNSVQENVTLEDKISRDVNKNIDILENLEFNVKEFADNSICQLVDKNDSISNILVAKNADITNENAKEVTEKSEAPLNDISEAKTPVLNKKINTGIIIKSVATINKIHGNNTEENLTVATLDDSNKKLATRKDEIISENPTKKRKIDNVIDTVETNKKINNTKDKDNKVNDTNLKSKEILDFITYLNDMNEKFKLNLIMPEFGVENIGILTPNGCKLFVTVDTFNSFYYNNGNITCQMCVSYFNIEEKQQHMNSEKHIRSIMRRIDPIFSRMINTVSRHCLITNKVVYNTEKSHIIKKNKEENDINITNIINNQGFVQDGGNGSEVNELFCIVCNTPVKFKNRVRHSNKTSHNNNWMKYQDRINRSQIPITPQKDIRERELYLDFCNNITNENHFQNVSKKTFCDVCCVNIDTHNFVAHTNGSKHIQLLKFTNDKIYIDNLKKENDNFTNDDYYTDNKRVATFNNNDDIIIVTAKGVEWRIGNMKFHGFIDVNGVLKCQLCEVNVHSINSHIDTNEHVRHILQPVDKRLVRQINDKQNHCIFCNKINLYTNKHTHNLPKQNMYECQINTTIPRNQSIYIYPTKYTKCHVCKIFIDSSLFIGHTYTLKHETKLKKIRSLYSKNNNYEKYIIPLDTYKSNDIGNPNKYIKDDVKKAVVVDLDGPPIKKIKKHDINNSISSAYSNTLSNLQTRVAPDGVNMEVTTANGNKELIPRNDFHSFKDKNGVLSCQMCQITFSDVGEHSKTELHMKLLMQGIDNDFIRKVNKAWSHCILCNQMIFNGFDHVSQSIKHKKYNPRTTDVNPKAPDQKNEVKENFNTILDKVQNHMYKYATVHKQENLNNINDNIDASKDITNNKNEVINVNKINNNVKLEPNTFTKNNVLTTNITPKAIKRKLDTTTGKANATSQVIDLTQSPKVATLQNNNLASKPLTITKQNSMKHVNITQNSNNNTKSINLTPNKHNIEISEIDFEKHYIEFDKSTLKCLICEVLISKSSKSTHISDHNKGGTHQRLLKILLKENKINKTSTGYFCCVCHVYMDDFIEHTKNLAHEKNIISTKKINENELKKYVYGNFEEGNLTKMAYLDIYNDLLMKNRIKNITPLIFSCDVCSVWVMQGEEIDHIYSNEHKKFKGIRHSPIRVDF